MIPPFSLSRKVYWPGTDFEFVDVVGQHLVEPAARARAGRDQLAHVRNVEDADVVSHRLVFVHDARVLHRHDPIAERDHLRAEPHVLFDRAAWFFGRRHSRATS